MPTPYLVAICKSSALDEGTNNYSLFNLVEQVQVPRPTSLPYEIHVYWQMTDEEIGQEFEMRVIIHSDVDERRSPGVPFTTNTRRHRVRITGGLPALSAGQYEIRVESRLGNVQQWTRHGIMWPLDVEELPEAGAA